MRGERAGALLGAVALAVIAAAFVTSVVIAGLAVAWLLVGPELTSAGAQVGL